MAELGLLEAINTGGNVAIFALLALIYRQSQIINNLRVDLEVLKTLVGVHEKHINIVKGV